MPGFKILTLVDISNRNGENQAFVAVVTNQLKLH
jgi:hypothetical protein